MSTLRSARIWWREGHPLVSRWTHDENDNLTWVAHAANAYYRWTRWVRPSWWLTIWRPPEVYYGGTRGRWGWRDLKTKRTWKGTAGKWTVRWCRLRGHPAGPIYYSSGMEPDGRCANCLEDIEGTPVHSTTAGGVA